MGSSGHLVNPSLQDVPGLSQDVPHGILRTSSQPQFAGCPRTVPGRPTWDPPDIQSTAVCRMSQDYPRTSLMGSSLANPLCPDSPGMCPTLVGNTGHLSSPSVQSRNPVHQVQPHSLVMAALVEWSRHNFPLEKTCKYLFVPVGVLPTCLNGIHFNDPVGPNWRVLCGFFLNILLLLQGGT